MISSQELLQKAIEAAKAERPSEARALLKQVVELEPRNERAWLWLSRVVESDKQRVLCLRNALVINPDNETAREELNILKGSAATIEPLPEGIEKPAPLVMPGIAAPGVASERAEAEPHEATPAMQPWGVDADDKTRLDTEGQRKGSGCALFVLGGVGGIFLLLVGFLLAGALGLIELPGGLPPSGPIYETTEEPTLTATATPAPDFDDLYLTCLLDIEKRCNQILDDVDSTGSLAISTQDLDIFCAGQVAWPRRVSELRAAHADCPFPTDQRLRAIRENFDRFLEELAQATDCWRAYCDSGNLHWFEEGMTYFDQGSIYTDRVLRQMEQYMAGSE